MKNNAKQNMHTTDYATTQASGGSAKLRRGLLIHNDYSHSGYYTYTSDFFLGYFLDKYRFMLALG